MEMKVSTVSVSAAPASQSAAFPSSDPGFSEILSGVRSAAFDEQLGLFRPSASAAQQSAADAGQNVKAARQDVQQSESVQQGSQNVQQSVQQGSQNVQQSTQQDGGAQNSEGVQQNAQQTAPQTEGAQQGENVQQSAGTAEAPVFSEGQSGRETEILNGLTAALTDTQMTVGMTEVSVKLENRLVQLVEWLVRKDEGADEDKIIRLLLDYLKKMQQSGGDDDVSGLAMQMLMSMLGGQQAPSYDLHIEIRSASEEITAVMAEYSQTSVKLEQQTVSQEMPGEMFTAPDTSQEQTFAFEMPLQQTAQAVTNEEAQPEAEVQPGAVTAEVSAAVKTERTEQIPARTARQEETPELTAREAVPQVQPQTAQAQAAPAQDSAAQTVQTAQTAADEAQPVLTAVTPETAEQMLESILGQAREELGLEKAEFTQAGPQTAVRPQETKLLIRGGIPEKEPVQAKAGTADEQPVQTSEAAVLEFRPNHRDGRNELDSILGGQERSDEQKKPAAPEQNSTNAGADVNAQASRPERVSVPVKEETAHTAVTPPERQLADELLSRAQTLEGGRTEFTMVLNPESLGRITVRMASAGGRVEVSITAENDATRQLLESRTEQLGAALRQNGVELERYQIVSGHENAQLMQDNYDGSSKNPYGRPDEEDGENSGGDDENDFLEILQQI